MQATGSSLAVQGVSAVSVAKRLLAAMAKALLFPLMGAGNDEALGVSVVDAVMLGAGAADGVVVGAVGGITTKVVVGAG